MSKPVPRSRLNITYRTRIEGRPVKQKLPFRLLVLGDFSGGNPDKLEARPVHSILPGMRIGTFMDELEITAPIEDRELATRLVGRLRGSVTGVIKKELDGGRAVVRLTGKAEVIGERADNGLGGFRGEVVLSGDVEVPLKDEKVTIGKPSLRAQGKVEGDITGNVDTTFAFDFTKGPIGVDDIKSDVSAAIPVILTIPLRGLRSFTPEFVAASVPEIRRLMLLRRLLMELRAQVSNRVELREIFKNVLQNNTADLAQLREWLIQNYPKLTIDPKHLAAGSAPSPGTSSGGAATPAPPPKSPPPAQPAPKA